MRSGIGLATHLVRFDITVVADLPRYQCALGGLRRHRPRVQGQVPHVAHVSLAQLETRVARAPIR